MASVCANSGKGKGWEPESRDGTGTGTLPSPLIRSPSIGSKKEEEQEEEVVVVGKSDGEGKSLRAPAVPPSMVYQRSGIVPMSGNMYSLNGGYGMYNNGMNNGMNNGYGGYNGGDPAQATLQLIESVIGAVSGFATMLESAYTATHSSFFTLVSIVEQFKYFKQVLGSALGIFSVMKYLKRLMYYVSQGRMGVGPRKRSEINGRKLLREFERFQSMGNGDAVRTRLSWKPLLFFLVSIFGFPYVLNMLIKKLQQNSVKMLDEKIDFNNLEFARALYDFTPEDPRVEIALRSGDLMAILSKRNPLGQESDWWKVRSKNGATGYVPSNYVEIIQRDRRTPAKVKVQ